MKPQSKQHFSHDHILLLLQPDEGELINCQACENPISEPFHGCLPCNFHLHDGCLAAPRSLDHPSHPSHPLTLHPTPTYPSRSFTCNACGSQGKAYSFSCARCEFDLHVQCACMPKTTLVGNHPHQLKMIFGSPYKDKTTIFACDVCDGTMDPDQWLYYCGACDFGAHLGCAASNGRPGNDSRSKAAREEEEEENGGANVGWKDSRVEAEKAMFEAERELQEQRIAHQLMLQALDNAGDYVGSSYTRKYYYY
ncbi:hypothetical protein DH2020_025695 [Rehmannia glutinosa]|uniref:DC1 domain-containing protein n=1 Tax=Rehmannia glutinosa TaxID=99300 RepID=A0ABR0W2K5_REHGL